MPFHNEEAAFARHLPELLAFAAAHPAFHFYLADDCSTDAGPTLLSEALSKNPLPNIRLLKNPSNLGKARTIKNTILSLPEPFLAFMDGDMAYPFDLLLSLHTALQTSDLVIASRPENSLRSGRNSIRRAFLGQGFNALTRFLFGLPFRDTQAGLKGFTRHAASLIFPRQRIISFAFDVELLVIARSAGLSISQLEAMPRPSHSYKKSHLRLLTSSVAMFRDLLLIKTYATGGLYSRPPSHL